MTLTEAELRDADIELLREDGYCERDMAKHIANVRTRAQLRRTVRQWEQAHSARP